MGKNIYQNNLVLPKIVQVMIVLFQVIVTLIWYHTWVSLINNIKKYFSWLLTVHGSWSNWDEYTPCSVTCGDGERSRTRPCLSGCSNLDDDDENQAEVCHESECKLILKKSFSKYTDFYSHKQSAAKFRTETSWRVILSSWQVLLRKFFDSCIMISDNLHRWKSSDLIGISKPMVK